MAETVDAERDWWEPGDGGPRPLSADLVEHGRFVPQHDQTWPDSPTLLDCERCGQPAAVDNAEAYAKTHGWLMLLLCKECDPWAV